MDQTTPIVPSPVPTPAVPAPTMPAKSKVPRIMMWAVVGVVVLAGAYGVLAWYQQLWPFASEINTANWKTFTNETGGYSFQYPDDWSVAVNMAAPQNTLFGPGASGTSGLGGVELFNFTGSVQDFMAGVEAQYGESQDVTIDGLPAIRVAYTGIAGSGTAYLLKKGGQIVNIYVNSGDSAPVAFLDALITTLHFTTPNPTAGWKTYTDTTYSYSFEIRYPAGWKIEKNPNYYGGGVFPENETPYGILYDDNPQTIADVKAGIFYVGVKGNGEPYMYPSKYGLFGSQSVELQDFKQTAEQILSTFKFTK